MSRSDGNLGGSVSVVSVTRVRAARDGSSS